MRFNKNFEWLLSLVAIAIMGLLAYYSGEIMRNVPLIVPIILFSMCAIGVITVLYPPFKISRDAKITILGITLALSAFVNISLFDRDNFHAESSICKVLLKGYIKTEDYEAQSDDGQDYSGTRYEFVPATKRGKLEKNLIDLFLVEISVSSILFPYFLLRHKLKVSF